MPQVVVACHGKAPLRQVGRQGLVPQDVLRHAVGDLQNGPGVPCPGTQSTAWMPVFPSAEGKVNSFFTMEKSSSLCYTV